MEYGNFRGVVREELVLWMEKNRGRFDLLNSRILDQLAPIVAEQLQRGILARLGHIEPDEREHLTMLLEQARAFISRYGLGKLDRVDQADVLLISLDGAISKLSAPPNLDKPGS